MTSQSGVKASLNQLMQVCSDCTAWLGRINSSEIEPDQIGRAFRSSELEAAAKSVYPESCHTEYGPSTETSFKRLTHLRSQLVEVRSIRGTLDTIAIELRRPRAILITDWRSSLFDGAATPETDGFLDDDYMPGWDSWLDLVGVEGAYGEMCLLSWIPAWLGDRVDSGIIVDPAECMAWAEVLPKGSVRRRGWGKRW